MFLCLFFALAVVGQIVEQADVSTHVFLYVVTNKEEPSDLWVLVSTKRDRGQRRETDYTILTSIIPLLTKENWKSN